MIKISLKHLLAGVVMLAAAAGAVILKPTRHLADLHRIQLNTLIPEQFDDWRTDQSVVPVQVDPEVQAKLDKIYSQVLSRTYINSHGQQVMLSIAYGRDQSDQSAVHRPEICYPAQGFYLNGVKRTSTQTRFGAIPVSEMVAAKSSRVEPIIYWFSVGGMPVYPGSDQKFKQLKFGLQGVVPDGLVFRVSTINSQTEEGFELDRQFINLLLNSLPEKSRQLLIGK